MALRATSGTFLFHKGLLRKDFAFKYGNIKLLPCSYEKANTFIFFETLIQNFSKDERFVSQAVCLCLIIDQKLRLYYRED